MPRQENSGILKIGLAQQDQRLVMPLMFPPR